MTNETTVYSAISGIAIDSIQLQWFPLDFTPKWVEVGTGGILPVGFLTSAFVRLACFVEKRAPLKSGSMPSSAATFSAPAVSRTHWKESASCDPDCRVLGSELSHLAQFPLLGVGSVLEV